MKNFRGESYFSNIAIWKANSTFKLQRLVCFNGDLNSSLFVIDEKFFTKRVGDLREGLVIPEVYWDSRYSYPEGYCVREGFTREGFPMLQRKTPLVEVARSLIQDHL